MMFHLQNKKLDRGLTIETLNIEELQAQVTPSLKFTIEITDEISTRVIEKGVCKASTGIPIYSGDKVSDTFYSGSGIYYFTATGLLFNTLYYTRGFVKLTSGEIIYGNLDTATTQRNCFIAELLHRNVTSNSVDVGIVITRIYITESLNQTKVAISTTNPPVIDVDPTAYIGQVNIIPGNEPIEVLWNGYLGDIFNLQPNTTYYYKAEVFLAGGPCSNQINPLFGIGTFTTLP